MNKGAFRFMFWVYVQYGTVLRSPTRTGRGKMMKVRKQNTVNKRGRAYTCTYVLVPYHVPYECRPYVSLRQGFVPVDQSNATPKLPYRTYCKPTCYNTGTYRYSTYTVSCHVHFGRWFAEWFWCQCAVVCHPILHCGVVLLWRYYLSL